MVAVMTVTLAKTVLKKLKRFGSYTATIFSEEMQYSRPGRYKNEVAALQSDHYTEVSLYLCS